MPWQEQSTMTLKQEFVMLASQEGANRRQLCRRFGISPPTGYKWLARYQAEGEAGLGERSRRPGTSPTRTDGTVEAAVLAVRAAHPGWGGRKIRAWLLARSHQGVPSASTITAILRRYDQLDPAEAAAHTAWQRFAHPAPNDLWQVDFKGPLTLATGACHPLSVLDDHARFLLGLVACADQQELTVRTALITLFRRYGLPWRMLTDNGPPWGSTTSRQPLTRLSIWLLRLDITVLHGRPCHPQTQGKVERFHRTLGSELLRDHAYQDHATAQTAFDTWRASYNQERPHEALNLTPPITHYRPSIRPFPETLPPIGYDPAAHVRKVGGSGQIQFRGHWYFLSHALAGQPIALTPSTTDGVWLLAFARHRLGTLDERTHAVTCSLRNLTVV